jgi:Flp pilus assembly protein TadG
MRILSRIRRFRDDTSGLALVEFAICLPLTLLIFATIIEGGRMMWSFQAAISGVRDATRYMSRTTPADICVNLGSFDDRKALITDIVRNRVSSDGSDAPVLPVRVTVVDVTASPVCEETTPALRISPTPVVQVTALVRIEHPWSAFFDGALGSESDVTISDEARAYGI